MATSTYIVILNIYTRLHRRQKTEESLTLDQTWNIYYGPRQKLCFHDFMQRIYVEDSKDLMTNDLRIRSILDFLMLNITKLQ